MNPDRQCTATSVQSGERCRKAAIKGGPVCEFHGGSAPQVRAAANRRLAEDKARRSLDEIDVTPIEHPLEAFGQLVAEAVALKDALASQVAALENMRAEPSKWGRAEQVRAEVSLYERAMDRAGKLLEQWVRLGLEERLVAQRERGEKLFIDYVNASLFAAWTRSGVPLSDLARLHLLFYDELGRRDGYDAEALKREADAALEARAGWPKVPIAELPIDFLDDNPDCAQYVVTPNRTALIDTTAITPTTEEDDPCPMPPSG